MKEKKKTSLRSLRESYRRMRQSFDGVCAKGWNAFCTGVCNGLRWISNRLRCLRRKISPVADRCLTSIRNSRLAAFLSSLGEKIRDSRPVRAVRAKRTEFFQRFEREIPQKTAETPNDEALSTEKKTPAELVEDNEISTEQIENELRREKFLIRYRKLLRSTVYALIVTAAAAALVATLLLPVLQIYGNSMTPTLREGDIVVSVKTNTYNYGDICSFYYSNRILVKRVIGKPLDRIDIDAEGNVYVNGKLLDEPYIKEKALGECDIEFPFRVPEGSYFMIGDHRATSIDSRSSSIGCISHDEIVGKILFTVWPIKHMGIAK